MAERFVLVRIVNMRGVDLNVFDFDFDLTWAALFMNANDFVYGRYGARDEGPAESRLSLAGLKYAMQQSLDAHRRNANAKPLGKVDAEKKLPNRAENFPAARRLKAGACIHCHQVYDFRTNLLWTQKKWNKDRMWIYPPPKNVGLELETKQGDRIRAVKRDSAAEKAGLRSGDVLKKLNQSSIASVADIQHALHRAPKSGRIPLSWIRNGRELSGNLELVEGWRKSDISWRGSMWSMPPAPGIYGRNLTPAEKRRLGLGEKRLAFRQGNYVPPRTQQAGIRAKDVIIGIDGKVLEMTMLQFNVYIRANYKVGDRVKLNVIRNARRIDVPMTLPVHPRF